MALTNRPIVRHAWRACGERSGFDVVGIGELDRRSPPLVLHDLNGESRDDHEMRPDGSDVIVLVGAATRSALAEALRSGARAVVTERDIGVELDEAVRRVWSGGGHISALAAPLVMSACAQGSHPNGTATPRLTGRENDVIRALVEGHTIKSTARFLGVAVKTVEAHRSRAFTKLGVRTQSEAVARVLGDRSLLSIPGEYHSTSWP